MQIEKFIDDVIAWAESHNDIKGLAIVGSFARDDARPDSDLDLVILAINPKELAEHKEWINQFGEPGDIVNETYGIMLALRVFYMDGLEVEFGIVSPGWAEVPLDDGTRKVISDGMRIQYDPDGLLREAETSAGS